MTNKSLPPRQSRRSIDGVIRQPSTDTAQSSTPMPQKPRMQKGSPGRRLIAYAPNATPRHATGRARFKGLKNTLSYIGIVVLAVAIGASLMDSRIGQWLVVAGGVVALILRSDSRIIFGAALFCLVMVPIMTLFDRQAPAENYALYAFILLGFGTIRAMIEAAGDVNRVP